MIAIAPHILRPTRTRMEFEHLILGDLRQLLDESPSRERDRWLLATLDMLLVSRPRAMSQIYLPAIPRETDFGNRNGFCAEPQVPFDKLQRLRDRIAHRAPYEPLAHELRSELRDYMERGLRIDHDLVVRAD